MNRVLWLYIANHWHTLSLFVLDRHSNDHVSHIPKARCRRRLCLIPQTHYSESVGHRLIHTLSNIRSSLNITLNPSCVDSSILNTPFQLQYGVVRLRIPTLCIDR